MNHNKNEAYTMFHICTTKEKYSVYYDYAQKCFYGCTYHKEEAPATTLS